MITTISLLVSLTDFIFVFTQRNITLVKGWILFKTIGISLCIIYLLTTILLGFATPIGIFLDLTEIGVFLYFFWIVYAYMKKLVEEQVFKMSPSIIQTQGKIEVSFPLWKTSVSSKLQILTRNVSTCTSLASLLNSLNRCVSCFCCNKQQYTFC